MKLATRGLVLWGLARSVRVRRVLEYGHEVAKPMPQAHVPRFQVSLLHAGLIGNAYLGSGRLPWPGSRVSILLVILAY